MVKYVAITNYIFNKIKITNNVIDLVDILGMFRY